MEIEEIIQKRFSCRSFIKNKEIPDELMLKLIKLCQKAPSAGNLQAYRVIVVKNYEVKQRLAKAALDQNFIISAPVILIVSAAPSLSEWKYRERGRSLYSIQDATIFAAYIELICTAFGLGSVWVGAFSELQVINIIKKQVADNFIEKPIALIAIGYCSEKPTRMTSRININDLIHIID